MSRANVRIGKNHLIIQFLSLVKQTTLFQSQIVVLFCITLAKEKGLTLLIVTHDQEFADQTDRIITMGDGKILT